jgi:hypothetical protein
MEPLQKEQARERNLKSFTLGRERPRRWRPNFTQETIT